MRLVLAVLALINLAACSNASTIADEPLRSGNSFTVKASYEAVKKIVPESIKETGVGVTQQTETEEGTIINVSKGVTAFSWGYVGRVFVERSDDRANTTVYVNFERRFSGMSKSSYADKLSKQISSDIHSR